MEFDGFDGGEFVADKGVCVRAEFFVIDPEVAPDSEHAAQVGGNDGGGEGFKDNGTVIANVAQRLEEVVEIDIACSEIPAVALADVDIAKNLGGIQDRGEHIRLFDIHVIGIQVNAQVVAINILEISKGLTPGVENIRLVPVDNLKGNIDATICAFVLLWFLDVVMTCVLGYRVLVDRLVIGVVIFVVRK